MRNETISEQEKELRRRRSEKVQAWWRNPENRRIMLEKQKRIGYRNYGDGIFYSINSKRRT